MELVVTLFSGEVLRKIFYNFPSGLFFLKLIKNNFLFRKLTRKLSERKIRLSAAINKTNINFLFLFFHQNTEKAPRNYPNMQQREENVPP